MSRSAPTYLFVPPGAKTFTVAVSGQGTGETTKCSLLRPDGTQVAAFNTTGKMADAQTITVPDGADGAVWCISAMTKGDEGIFEDFGYSLSGDISPYVSENPADLLCPIVQAESALVSREARDDITFYTDFAELGDAELTLGVQDADGEPLYEDTRESATSRQLAMGPDDRLDTGKYRWELTLLQGGDEVTSFSGLWYYIPALPRGPGGLCSHQSPGIQLCAEPRGQHCGGGRGGTEGRGRALLGLAAILGGVATEGPRQSRK